MAALLAATHPNRVLALITYAAFAKAIPDAGYSMGIAVDTETVLALPEDAWEKPGLLPLVAPSRLEDERFRAWWARNQRLGASPAGAAALVRMIAEIDIREVLPTIRVPTLVLQRRDDRIVPPPNGRFLAECIPGAKYVELTEGDYFIGTGDVDAIVEEIADFLTGARPPKSVEGRLAAIVIADIRDPDAHATRLGDSRWRALVAEYTGRVLRTVERFGGTLVHTEEIRWLATFDGPARAVRCGHEIAQAASDLSFQVGVVVHAGEIELDSTNLSGLLCMSPRASPRSLGPVKSSSPEQSWISRPAPVWHLPNEGPFRSRVWETIGSSMRSCGNRAISLRLGGRGEGRRSLVDRHKFRRRRMRTSKRWGLPSLAGSVMLRVCSRRGERTARSRLDS